MLVAECDASTCTVSPGLPWVGSEAPAGREAHVGVTLIPGAPTSSPGRPGPVLKSSINPAEGNKEEGGGGKGYGILELSGMFHAKHAGMFRWVF